MPAPSIGHDFPDITQNYRGGLKLLHLATEQVRIFDPVAAEQIARGCLQPLQIWFERAITSAAHQLQVTRDQDTARRLEHMRQVSQDAWSHDIKPRMPPTPPGLGFDKLGFQEARPGKKADSAFLDHDKTLSSEDHHGGLVNASGSQHQLPSSLLTSPERAPTSMTSTQKAYAGLRGRQTQSRDYGVIGSQKTSTAAAQSSTYRGDPSAVSADEVADVFGRSSQTAGLGLTHEGNLTRQTSNGYQTGSDAADFDAAVRAYVLANKDNLLSSMLQDRQREASAQDPYDSSPFKTASTPASSWDGAATRRASQVNTTGVQQEEPIAAGQTEADEPLPAPGPSSWAKIAAMTADNGPSQPGGTIALSSKAATSSLIRSQPQTRRPSEPTANMHRAVYLARLPPTFTLRNVSAQITQGPVMSILLATDADPSMPAKSACIIFMTAEACSTFLSANGWSFSQNKFVGPTSYATAPATAALRRTSGLTDIQLIPCGPYPLDSHLLSMAHPTNARRRVKWSRSRLFYDVSQRQFKRDVLAIVGGTGNVEFFHFYNPGECTVVFASVGVAAACVSQFEEWSREKLEGATRWLKEDDVAVQSKVVGHLDKKKGRYEGVEVGFVKDFNECPTVLYSHYGRDGRLSERVEGLYEGPAVG